jgi:hypothetical protein
MRPNLRNNRNQTPLKLVNADPVPAQPKKLRKLPKRKFIRRKALTKAQTVAEEIVNTTEQLITL